MRLDKESKTALLKSNFVVVTKAFSFPITVDCLTLLETPQVLRKINSSMTANILVLGCTLSLIKIVI